MAIVSLDSKSACEPRCADLVIAGASCRALAQSCLRAGLAPIACDLFADTDLAALCTVRRLERDRYPDGLLEELAALPALPFVYTGGLETRPDLLAAIARRQRLLGCGADSVRLAKDPFAVREVLERAGLPAPKLRRHDSPPPAGDREEWLSKPRRGSGGAGIRVSDGSPEGDDRFFQERIGGTAASAVFVAARDPEAAGATALLLACTEQLVGADWLGARPFAYCGSIAPFPVSRAVRGDVESVGRELARAFALRGLFGVDFVIAGDHAHAIEVNPRYTASVEVVESALGLRALDLHVRACRGEPIFELAASQAAVALAGVAAKAVVYTESEVRFAGTSPQLLAALERLGGRLADVPSTGAVIGAGRPLFTLLTAAPGVEEARSRLRALREAVRVIG